MSLPADCKGLTWKRPRRSRLRRWFDWQIVIVRNGQQHRLSGLVVYMALATMTIVTFHAIGYVAATAVALR